MLSFQSVLSEVIDNFNNYFEGLQGKFFKEELYKKSYLNQFTYIN